VGVFSKTSRSSAVRVISRVSRVQSSRPLLLIMRNTKSIHTSYLVPCRSILILWSRLRLGLPSSYFSSGFRKKLFIFLDVTHARYMHSMSHPFKVWWSIQNMKLLLSLHSKVWWSIQNMKLLLSLHSKVRWSIQNMKLLLSLHSKVWWSIQNMKLLLSLHSKVWWSIQILRLPPQSPSPSHN
jgi:hypothetical protein